MCLLLLRFAFDELQPLNKTLGNTCCKNSVHTFKNIHVTIEWLYLFCFANNSHSHIHSYIQVSLFLFLF